MHTSMEEWMHAFAYAMMAGWKEGSFVDLSHGSSRALHRALSMALSIGL